jgi:AraC-like DNA-binding protein
MNKPSPLSDWRGQADTKADFRQYSTGDEIIMQHPYHKTIRSLSPMGILIRFATTPGGYFPLHWHEELELLYPLNGEITLRIAGENHLLPQRTLAVIDPCQIHSTYCRNKTSMFLNIHLSKRLLENYLPDISLRQLHCLPGCADESLLPEYREVCSFAEELVLLYMKDTPVFMMEAEGIVLQLLAHLFRNFSVNAANLSAPVDILTMERIRTIITYTEEHFRETVSLGDVAARLGLGKESFCRFVKKNMGMSYLNYLNEVRLSHVYKALLDSDTPVGEIMASNGFTNQKLFNRAFKELYGQTPSSVRRGP